MKRKNQKNPVDRFMREGEDGWKPQTHSHKHLKKYTRKDRRNKKFLGGLNEFDGEV